MAIAAVFIDVDTLRIVGDYTATLIVGRKVRCNCGVDGLRYGWVLSAAYAAPNTTVDLTSDSDALTANLTEVDWSVVKPGIVSANVGVRSFKVREASGDPTITFTINDVDAFTVGVDDDDNNKFKISRGGALGVNDVIDIDPAGNIVINEGGADANFRIEGNSDVNLISVDAGLDNVGFGVAAADANVKVQIEPATNEWALHLNSPNIAGQSFGLKITAGTDDTDQALVINTADGLGGIFIVRGNGQVFINSQLFINDTANVNMTQGLTINQGANDDELLAFKSSDVAHGMTAVAETDTYGFHWKQHDATGGLNITGLTEDIIAIGLSARSVNEDTNKATTSHAYIELQASKRDGAGPLVTIPGANANIVAILSGVTTRFIFDNEGTVHLLTGDNDLDIIALSATTGTPTLSWDESEDDFALDHGLNIHAGDLGVKVVTAVTDFHVLGLGLFEGAVPSVDGGFTGKAVTIGYNSFTDAGVVQAYDYNTATYQNMEIRGNVLYLVGTTVTTPVQIENSVYVAQGDVSAAIPVATFFQIDVSEEFLRFHGTAAAGVLTRSIVDEGDQGSEQRDGWLKVYVIDDGNQITDQGYFVPIYTLSA